MIQSAFSAQGQWYKGCLHMHSTRSDGDSSPQERIALYKDNGYDFLCFTEHRVYNYNEELDGKGLLLIPGVELDTHGLNPEGLFHIDHFVGASCSREGNYPAGQIFKSPPWKGKETAQGLIDDLRAHNNFVIYCHPLWSRVEPQDVLELDEFNAIEIYNHSCAVDMNIGHCEQHWDALLRRGRKVWGIATDDCHRPSVDACGGFAVVKAPELSEKAITNALMNGEFYSSCGPAIHSFGVEDGEVFVECSEAAAISFVCYELWGHTVRARADELLTSARIKLREPRKSTPAKVDYVRAEVIDPAGRKAWTQPVFI